MAQDSNWLRYSKYDAKPLVCWQSIFRKLKYILARNALIEKDLIAFDGYLFQALSLPPNPPVDSCAPIKGRKEMQKHDPAAIRQLLVHSFGKKHD